MGELVNKNKINIKKRSQIIYAKITSGNHVVTQITIEMYGEEREPR